MWLCFVVGLIMIMLICAVTAVDGLLYPEEYALSANNPLLFYLLFWGDLALALVSSIFLLSLFAQHLYFVAYGITTLEYIRDQAPGWPGLPPAGWREAVREGRCCFCHSSLELTECTDPEEVWLCAICQGDVGRAAIDFWTCTNCDMCTVCPLCHRLAEGMQGQVITFRTSALKRRVESLASPGQGDLGSGISKGSSAKIRPANASSPDVILQHQNRISRRNITSVVAAMEGHTGDAWVGCSSCRHDGDFEEDSDDDEESYAE